MHFVFEQKYEIWNLCNTWITKLAYINVKTAELTTPKKGLWRIGKDIFENA